MTQQQYQARKDQATAVRNAAQAEIDAADACIGEYLRGHTPNQQEIENEQAKWDSLLAEADLLV